MSYQKQAPYFRLLIPALLVSILWVGCDSVSDSDTLSGDWLISRSEVFDGGPGKDGIPSVDLPQFASVAETTYVPDDRRVIGIKIGNDIRAYPHQILDWHEIVNDEVGGVPIALTFCPLTGTASAWNREVDGAVTEFGVSGLIFRNNLVPYDRATDSNWSQMRLQSVNGSNIGKDIQTYQVVETTWETWKNMYPESRVLTRDTGFSRSYQSFTYGPDYSTNPSQILFPIRNEDDRLGRKDRVHGIFLPGSDPKVYPLDLFMAGIQLIEDRIEGIDYLIVGSAQDDFAAAFELEPLTDSNLEFSAVQNSLPIILEDNEGNRWDIFGTAVSGPRMGDRLKSTTSYTGYWFGWADFFPGLEIYGE